MQTALTCAHILHRDRLAAAGVVGHREHDQRNALAAHALNERLERRHIHVAFERMLQGGLSALGDDQVHGFGADELHIGAGGVEVGVVGDDVAFLAGHAEENALGGAALMGGDHVLVAADVLNRVAEPVEAAAARIALVAFHDGGPLVGGHGAGAGVGQQVDENIVRRKQKQVVVRGLRAVFRAARGWSSESARRS